MVDIDYFRKRQKLIELRYNPYHDPSNGRFTSGGGGGGGMLVVPKGQKGKGFYVAPDTLDKGEQALANGAYTRWQNAQNKKKAQAEAEEPRRKVTYENPFTHEKITTEVARENERLTEKGFKKTLSELNPDELWRTDSIKINGIEYRKDDSFSKNYHYTFQSTVAQERERQGGTGIEYPYVTIAVERSRGKLKINYRKSGEGIKTF